MQLTRISATDDSISELQAELESGLTLLGASAIFDQLQVCSRWSVHSTRLAPSRAGSNGHRATLCQPLIAALRLWLQPIHRNGLLSILCAAPLTVVDRPNGTRAGGNRSEIAVTVHGL